MRVLLLIIVAAVGGGGVWLVRAQNLPPWLATVPGVATVSAWARGEPSAKAEPVVRPDRAATRPQVQVATARSDDVPITLSGIGTVQAYNMVGVRSRVDGEIVEIRFREGQDVKAGDTLAVIDPRPLQAQLAQSEAIRAKDQALLAGAMLDLNRSESLVAKNFASQQQVDQQRALVEQYRAQVRSDEAQIDYARTQLGYTTIVSPIGGRTGIRQIDAGNYIRAGDAGTIVVVSQVQPISVVFTLPASAVAQSRLTLGETSIPVSAYAADDATLLDTGQVELVDNQVDQTTGTIKLKARFANERLRLWPGNFVNGRLTVETRRNGVTMPLSALRHGPRGDFAFVVKDGDTVEVRNLTSGQASGGRVLVERGLRAGERVVIDGHFRLENGTAVEVMASPEPAGRPAGATGREARPARSPS